MAASRVVRILHLPKPKLSNAILVQQSPCYPMLQFVRHSRYSDNYMEATVDRDELRQPLAKEDLRNFQPIKAATSEQNTSITFDPLVTKFVRLMITRGRKQGARKSMDRTYEQIKLTQLHKYHQAPSDEERAAIEIDPLTIFYAAVENCKPILMTQRARRGGITYTVPIPCTAKQQLFKSMKWLILTSREKGGHRWFWEKLSEELISASNQQGKSIRKKQELHRLCEANRAYSHYRW